MTQRQKVKAIKSDLGLSQRALDAMAGYAKDHLTKTLSEGEKAGTESHAINLAYAIWEKTKEKYQAP
jgi:predicted transcriptional regulator